ncbi:MAG: translesion error-prone DNA polymerase V autoproteolytic subunit [Balneolaceae bacterium]|nr:translesion error-prone DNA polymerase V autoproteolytic subunit [Balneolaceae bacterium]
MDEFQITDIYSGDIERYKHDKEAKFSKETGFPSPARDHYEKRLSLDEHIIRRPAATFFVRVKGNGLNNIGIYSQDILVVDRSLKPFSGCLVVVILEGEHTLRRLEKRKGTMFLCTKENQKNATAITNDLDYEIWGVVSHSIHKHI